MKIDLDELIPGSRFFRWKEALFHKEWGVHVFPTDQHYFNIARTAKIMDQIRTLFLREVAVTSWYRTPFYNSIIGGSRFSAHKLGLACDFQVQGYDADTARGVLLPMLEPLAIRMEKPPPDEKHDWIHIDLNPPGKSGRYFNVI